METFFTLFGLYNTFCVFGIMGVLFSILEDEKLFHSMYLETYKILSINRNIIGKILIIIFETSIIPCFLLIDAVQLFIIFISFIENITRKKNKIEN